MKFDNYIKLAQKATQRITCDQKGSCMTAAEWITTNFLKQGIIDFKVVEGWVKFKKEGGEEYDSPRFQHTWIEKDGKIIDPTLKQFNGWDLNSVWYYRRKKRYDPQEYLDLSEKYPVYKPERFKKSKY